MQITRRAATELDREFVYRLNRAAYRAVVTAQFGSWDEDWQRRNFDRKWGESSYEILEEEGRAVGVLSVAEEPDAFVLEEIQILPQAQNRGIGSLLVRQELERASRADKPLRLQVLKRNSGAQRLYERLGFRRTGESPTHVLMEAGSR